MVVAIVQKNKKEITNDIFAISTAETNLIHAHKPSYWNTLIKWILNDSLIKNFGSFDFGDDSQIWYLLISYLTKNITLWGEYLSR